MSIQTFPPEILDLFIDELGQTATEDPQSRAALLACALVNTRFYHQATSYIFSSLSISTRLSRTGLTGLIDIINTNPDIIRHIRSLRLEVRTHAESLPAWLKQLCHLQRFEWAAELFPDALPQCPITASIGNLCHLPSLTTLHLERIKNFPLSLFSGCYHLESLTLIMVRFAKIGPKTLSSSLFSSMKRLEILGPLREIEAIRLIMIHAAPTLTTLVLCNAHINNARSLNLDTIVFPVLESIKMSCTIFLGDNDTLPPFISHFLDYSAPTVNRIQIDFLSEMTSMPTQFFVLTLPKGWSLFDKILSGPQYPVLKTLGLTLSEKYPLVGSSELDILPLLNEILPLLSSCGQTDIKIWASEPPSVQSCMEINFVFY